MDVEEVLRKAAAAVEAAGIPEELRVAAFERAVDLFSGSVAPNTGESITDSDHQVPRSVEEPLTKISTRLDLETHVVSDVYFMDGEVPGVGVAASAIDSRKAGGTKQLALLVAGGRQLGGIEEWTSLEHIRALASEYARYDDSNFAATIQEMADYFQIRGARRSREVRMKRPGIEALARLVSRLAGVDR